MNPSPDVLALTALSLNLSHIYGAKPMTSAAMSKRSACSLSAIPKINISEGRTDMMTNTTLALLPFMPRVADSSLTMLSSV